MISDGLVEHGKLATRLTEEGRSLCCLGAAACFVLSVCRRP